MQTLKTAKGLAKIWADGVEIADNAIEQIRAVADLPFVYKHVAVMPDAHWGLGCTIGTVIPSEGAIVPAAVGVDLGCGMIAKPLGVHANHLPDRLRELRSAIEAAVPHGRGPRNNPNTIGSWKNNPPAAVQKTWLSLGDEFDRLVEREPKIERSNHVNHLGTLGTGNHFIELCLDETDQLWIMLHSGSRGVGNRIASLYIEKAKKECERLGTPLADPNLAYLPEHSQVFKDYTRAVLWAQKFAAANRVLMMKAVLQEVLHAIPHAKTDGQEINCHHNYIARERHFGKDVWVTRKGAVRAREDDYGIIPGSMGAKSFIVRGLGNPESFHSCSHGAGRMMSRREARKRISLEQHARDTRGVECRKDSEVLDESPRAYKDIDAVMAAQADLVEPIHTLRQILCVKG